MNPNTSFWHAMQELLRTHPLLIDRPKGSPHPRYPDWVYPFDYGYLKDTVSSDGGGIDVWVGSLNRVMDEENTRVLTGILCTFDTLKRDAELKLLIACSEEDIQVIRDFHSGMYTLYIANPMVDNALSN